MYPPILTLLNAVIDNMFVIAIFVSMSLYHLYKTDSTAKSLNSNVDSLKTELNAEVKRINANIESQEKALLARLDGINDSISALEKMQESKHQELSLVAQARYDAILMNLENQGD